MSRRRPSGRHPREEKQQIREVDECIAIMETTITNYDKKRSVGSAVWSLLTWPMRLIFSIFRWLVLEVSDSSSSPEDNSKILPSIIPITLGFFLFRNYGDSFDNFVSSYFGSWDHITQNFFELLDSLRCENIKSLVIVSIGVIFWIGAFRIVCNIVRKLFEAQKLCHCN